MATKNYYEGVKHTVLLSSNISMGCEHCGEMIRSEFLANAINHYIDAHGYKLLHVGTDTDHDQDGKPWHSTVAVVGK